jgi:hypothetical protein
MGFNPKKELLKIKSNLETKGYKKNIPIDVFGVEIMLVLGAGKNKTVQWIANFETMGLITKNDNKISFRE